ncbi:sesterterpene synthase 2, terpene synthase 19 [Hibiscus trionum]|uniref:Sesterterpene synthase 2, terpene synthase 19 n=1 Tax=Hibiscus trionum TaxID=183268 RepID=A0A9W7J0Y1_HIBTR|nr:sesterterpene synthase 2, terpene synthase 19 [Hibiscus trionum]
MAVQGSVLGNTLCLYKPFSSPKPILPLRLHNTRANAKTCFAALSTDSASAAPLLQPNSNREEIGRPLANFAPDIWGDCFLTLPFHNSEFESCAKQVEMLKAKVKDMLVASATDPVANMHLIHTLCRLGVSHHFQNEIEMQLAHYFATLDEVIDHNKDHDLHTTAVIFQVFRFHGYNISSDVFNKFKDANGEFKGSDIKGIISLYEATQFRINGEVILEEAMTFTKSELHSIASRSTDSDLTEYILNAVNRPYLNDLERLEARQFIYFYEKDASRNQTLLKFAKYDFNWIQMLHQQELKVLYSWWNEMNIVSKFPYIRHRVVECYLTAVGYYFEPRYALARNIYTKMVMMWGILDDTYDAYATFEELQCLTDAMKRFDISAMDKLPADYLKLVYKTILDVHDEVEEMVRKEGRSFAVDYVRREFTETAEAFHEQARWAHEGYHPTFDEYIKTAMKSAGGNLNMAHALIGMGVADEKAYQCLINTDNMIYKAINLLCRLYNDIATNEREEKRGAVTGTMCYMKQYGVTRQEATEAFKDMIEAAFKDMNRGCLRPMPIPREIVNRVVNYLRLLDTFYMNDIDGYTIPETCMKNVGTKMFIHPIPL